MSAKIKGLTVEISGDTTNLGKALNSVEKQSKSLTTELKGVNTLLKFDSKNTELLSQKQKILTEDIKATSEKLKILKETQSQVQDQFERGDITAEQYRDFQREIIATETKLKKLEGAHEGVTREIAQTEKGYQKLTTEMKSNVTNAVKNLGQALQEKLIQPLSNLAMKAGIGFAALGTAGVAACKSLLASAGDFEQSMKMVQYALKASEDEMKELSALAKKMGADTVYSAKEAGDAILELAKSGMTQAQIKAGALESTMNLAAASGLGLGESASIVANTMNVFGLAAEDADTATNALAGAANASTAEVKDLTDALTQVGPGAVVAGMSLNETVGALAAFADNGIKGSDAGTSLKTMLTRLVPQTKAAKDAMAAYGLSFVDSNGNIASMTEVAGQLQEKLGGLTEEQKMNALATIFGSDATRAASVLMTEGAAGIQKYIDATNDSTAASGMAEARMSGWNGVVESVKGSVETLAISMGEALAPAAKSVGEKIKGALDSMQEGENAEKLKNTMAEFATKLGDMAANIIPKVIDFIPKLLDFLGWIVSNAGTIAAFIAGFVGLNVLGQVVGSVTAIGSAFKALHLALFAVNAETGLSVVGMIAQKAALIASTVATNAAAVANGLLNAVLGLNPIGIIIIAIVALVAAFVLLWNNCEGFRNFFIGMWEAIVGFITPILDGIKQTWDTIWNAIKTTFEAVWNAIKTVFEVIITVIAVAIGTYLAIIQAVWGAIWNGIKATFEAVWNGLVAFFTPIIEFISNLISTYINIVKTVWETIWNGIKTFFEGIWNAIVGFLGPIIEGIKNTITNTFNAIKTTVSGIIDGIKNAISTVFNAISTTVNNIFNGIKATVTTIWNGIKDAIMTPINAAKDLIKGAIDAIKGFFSFNISWPKIPMPKFGISPAGWKIGDLLSGSIPKLNITWNAKGGIMKGPTLFGASGSNLLGGGEAGPEAILPLTKNVLGGIGAGILAATENNNNELVNSVFTLTNEVKALKKEIRGMQLVLDSGAVVGGIADKMDGAFQRRSNLRERGVTTP